MAVVERALMGPGPSNPHPEDTAAPAAPMLVNLDPLLLGLLDETCHRRRAARRPTTAPTPPISGTGWAGREAAFVHLTSVVVPDGIDAARGRTQLLERFNIEIGGGAGGFAGSTWRIRCMGHGARRGDVTLVLAARAEVLDR